MCGVILAAAGPVSPHRPRARRARRRAGRDVPAGQELGPVGRRRSARLRQSGHRREAEAGGGAREERHHGVARAQRRSPRRAEDVTSPFEHTMNRGNQMDTLSRVVSRLRAQPHRRAVPFPLQGSNLQRLRAAPTSTPTRAAPKLGIDNLKSGIVTRGMLFDIPRLKNVDVPRAGHRDLTPRTWRRGRRRPASR